MDILKRKFKSLFSNEETTPYKYGLNFLQDSFNNTYGETINPSKLTRKEIAEYGLELFVNNDEWEEI